MSIRQNDKQCRSSHQQQPIQFQFVIVLPDALVRYPFSGSVAPKPRITRASSALWVRFFSTTGAWRVRAQVCAAHVFAWASHAKLLPPSIMLWSYDSQCILNSPVYRSWAATASICSATARMDGIPSMPFSLSSFFAPCAQHFSKRYKRCF